MENTNEIYEEATKTLATSERWLEDGKKRQLHILDLGTIMSIVDGLATVRSYEQQAGQVVIYPNVEVLYIGSVGGGMDIIPAGTLCLLVRTAIPILDTKTELLSPQERPYAGCGLKAIPLTNCSSTDVHFGFDEFGAFQIRTDTGLNITVSNSQLTVDFQGSTLFMIDESGNISRMSSNRTSLLQVTPEGITTTYYKADDKHDPLFKVTTTEEGVTYYTYEDNAWKKRYNLTNTEGQLSFGEKTNIAVTDKSVSIQTSDDVSAKLTDSAITLQSSSSMKIEMSSSAVTINGHLKVT